MPNNSQLGIYTSSTPALDGIYKRNKSGGICDALTEQCERVSGKQGIPQFKIIAERRLEKGPANQEIGTGNAREV